MHGTTAFSCDLYAIAGLDLDESVTRLTRVGTPSNQLPGFFSKVLNYLSPHDGSSSLLYHIHMPELKWPVATTAIEPSVAYESGRGAMSVADRGSPVRQRVCRRPALSYTASSNRNAGPGSVGNYKLGTQGLRARLSSEDVARATGLGSY
jgi:hypothetical protein